MSSRYLCKPSALIQVMLKEICVGKRKLLSMIADYRASGPADICGVFHDESRTIRFTNVDRSVFGVSGP